MQPRIRRRRTHPQRPRVTGPIGLMRGIADHHQPGPGRGDRPQPRLQLVIQEIEGIQVVRAGRRPSGPMGDPGQVFTVRGIPVQVGRRGAEPGIEHQHPVPCPHLLGKVIEGCQHQPVGRVSVDQHPHPLRRPTEVWTREHRRQPPGIPRGPLQGGQTRGAVVVDADQEGMICRLGDPDPEHRGDHQDEDTGKDTGEDKGAD